MSRLAALVALVLSVGSVSAMACPVCYGDLEPDQARGFFWGIVLLMVLPPALIFYIAGHVVYHSRRKSRVDLLIEKAEAIIQKA